VVAIMTRSDALADLEAQSDREWKSVCKTSASHHAKQERVSAQH